MYWDASRYKERVAYTFPEKGSYEGFAMGEYKKLTSLIFGHIVPFVTWALNYTLDS